MIILNTTFFSEEAIADDVRQWIAGVYIPAATKAGIFSQVETARVIDPVEPGVRNMAVRCAGTDLEAMRRWHDSTASLVKDDLASRWGQRVLWFTTYLEPI